MLEYLPHLITSLVSILSTAGIGYVWIRRQLVAVNKEQQANDDAKAVAAAVKETAASGAWQQLFVRCESERAEMKVEIVQLRKDNSDLKALIADQAADQKIMKAQIARLEKDSPCGQCPFAAAAAPKASV